MLVLNGVAKKYGRQLVLPPLTHIFEEKSKWVILGPNGSGKSTLIKMLSGALEATEGSIEWHDQPYVIEAKELGLWCGIAAPYVALNPHFTLKETLDFHGHFSGFAKNFEQSHWLDRAELTAHLNKKLGAYSSGMLQRVRLLLAIPSVRPIVLLDEPTSNLDENGVAFYKALISEFAASKTVVVGSNYIQNEYEFCTEELILQKQV